MIDVPDSGSDVTRSRLETIATGVIRKLSKRASVLLAALAIFLVFLLGGGLTFRAAISGAAVLFLWSALWPDGEAAGTSLADRELRLRTGEGALSANGPVWQAIVANLPDPAMIIDANGIILSFNRALAELFSGAQAGRHVSQVTRAPELLTSIDAARDGRQVQSCRIDFKVPVERSLVGTVAPLGPRQNRDETPDILIVMRDLTEQDRLIRMRADFVANASHELRTPLASLKGFVETLQGAAKDDTQARDKFLKIMQQQADRMARLIDDLLSLSRIEMRAHVAPRDAVNLEAVIAHVVQTLIPIAEEKLVAIDVEPATPAIVTGDRDELIQVFQNLIENAIKYGRDGGSVIVRQSLDTSAGGVKRIVVSVTDDGVGIAAKHLPRLTERFYRVNAEQSRNAGGTGLGLAIVKHVLNRHQADLHIESSLGQGSTFRVSFPPRR